MTRIWLLGCVSAAALLTGSVYANYSFMLEDSSDCSTISGGWSGRGKAHNWLLGSCTYHGKGTVSSVDSNGRFFAQVEVDKDHGVGLCPQHVTERIDAQCVNGLVTVKTDFGSLRGTFTSNSGKASGVLSVAPGIEADVTIQLSR